MQEKNQKQFIEDQADFDNDHDNQIDNTSDNRVFDDVLNCYVTRRSVMVGGLAMAAAGFLPNSSEARTDSRDYRNRYRRPLVGFSPVPVAEGSGSIPSIAREYRYDVLIPWGEPLEPAGPGFSYPPSAEDQAMQIGIGHDGMTFFPTLNFRSYRSERLKKLASRRGMLVVNHEFGRNSHVLGKDVPESLADVRASQHAHGVSVVEIAKRGRRWRTVESEKARRIHVNTPVRFSGPAADSPLLQTPNGNVALGTVNNCANGQTPWGTYLTCEENFNGYFGASNNETTWSATPEQQRYGFSENGFFYFWYVFDRRFDLSDQDYVNEENRFGWVVEIDPMDATRKPVKRTALGRFKHEGVALVEGRNKRVVAYMGDDQRFDYIYKFVSRDNWKAMRRQGVSPLDEGQLYVAKFNDDGSGEWRELTIENPALAARFSSQEEVLIYARIAADLLGATPMDRPEWTTVAPDGSVYVTLTNNSRREVADAANPLAPNDDGHIIRWKDSDKHVGTTFEWEIFLLSKNSHDTEYTYSDPDGLWADPDGRLFIQTDGSQKDGLNNQMLVCDIRTKELKRLFTGVTDDEITGIAYTPDRRTMFVNIQHPGNGDPAVTNFPAPQDGVTVPRDCTIVITRKNGGIIGS